MKCPFCAGDMQLEPSLPHTGQPGLECVHCSRSDDFWHEITVMIEQAKKHTGQHTYGANAEYSYRKRLGLPPVGKKGRSGRRSKWE